MDIRLQTLHSRRHYIPKYICKNKQHPNYIGHSSLTVIKCRKSQATRTQCTSCVNYYVRTLRRVYMRRTRHRERSVVEKPFVKWLTKLFNDTYNLIFPMLSHERAPYFFYKVFTIYFYRTLPSLLYTIHKIYFFFIFNFTISKTTCFDTHRLCVYYKKLALR